MEINKTVIVASRWFLYYLTYIDDARSNTNQSWYSVYVDGAKLGFEFSTIYAVGEVSNTHAYT